MARLPSKITKARADKLITAREDRLEYEAEHALESTIVMAFDATRNSIATFNNVALIIRNKSELKAVESTVELEQAYASLIA